MKSLSFKHFIGGALVGAPLLLAVAVHAQSATTPAAPAAVPGATQVKDNQGGGLVTFEAQLVDPAKKAAGKTATVDVKIAAAHLVDPDTTNGKPSPGQYHLHYQLDDGPVIATTATKLSFHNLPPGPHKITVSLAQNDHSQVGRENVLTVNIP